MSGDALAQPPHGISRPLTFLPRPLLEPRRPAVAILVGWLTAFGPSILLSALVTSLLPDLPQPEITLRGPMLFLAFVIFAPLVETLIMGCVLLVLLRLVSPALAIAISSIGWGIAHSTAAAAWGLIIWWPFLVFSTLFVTWRQRSIAAAFAISAAVHALQNLPSSVFLFAAQNGG